MGDRGNIYTHEDGSHGIYFYTHWSGSCLVEILQKALKRGKDRWGDPPYMNRIIFCEMIKDDVLAETGFGIATYEIDNEHPIVKVNLLSNMIKIKDYFWSFENFVKDKVSITPSSLWKEL